MSEVEDTAKYSWSSAHPMLSYVPKPVTFSARVASQFKNKDPSAVSSLGAIDDNWGLR